MTIKDSEADYLNETEAELRSRLVQYLQWAQFYEQAYSALLNYGVDFRVLPEYKDDEQLQVARKMKAEKRSELVINWITRLEHALKAAIRRKQLVGLKGGLPPKDTKH